MEKETDQELVTITEDAGMAINAILQAETFVTFFLAQVRTTLSVRHDNVVMILQPCIPYRSTVKKRRRQKQHWPEVQHSWIHSRMTRYYYFHFWEYKYLLQLGAGESERQIRIAGRIFINPNHSLYTNNCLLTHSRMLNIMSSKKERHPPCNIVHRYVLKLVLHVLNFYFFT